MKADKAACFDRVTIGRITRTQGRKGEVFAEILTDFPHRFKQLSTVFFQYPEGQTDTLAVEDSWLHRGGVVLKFKGVETIDAAQSLVGGIVQIEYDQLMPLPANTYYCFDLEGCEAYNENGDMIGRVIAVEEHSYNSLLIVKTEQGQEILIPTASEFIIKVDIVNKHLILRIPQELWRLNS